ncbi:MAG: alginate O-acetyltransferase AlgX-related protein [Chloroflexota bacterium]
MTAAVSPEAIAELDGARPDAARAGREPVLGRWLDRLVAVGFVAALAVPGALFAIGVRPESIENREQAEFPRVTLRALATTEFYAAIDAFLVDNLPGRNQAIEAHAELGQTVFGGTTDPKVVRGAGQWLFLRGEMEPECQFTAADVLGQIDRVAARLAASRRAFRYVVPPDKHGMYPERLLPDPNAEVPCTDTRRAAMQAGLAARPAAAVDLWTPTRRERKAQPNAPLYYIQDEHWTPLGAVPSIKALVMSLYPAAWRDTDVTIDGTEAHTADMSRLIGLPHDEIGPKVVMRPDVDVERTVLDPGIHVANARDIPWFTVHGTTRFVPGRTLFVYDSFFGTVMGRVAPFFEQSVWVHEGDLYNNPELAKALPSFDTIVFERVERSAYFTDVESVLAPVVASAPRN